MSLRAVPFAVGLVVALSPALPAQPLGVPGPPSLPSTVTIYTARNASPADLVRGLGRLYDGTALRSVASASGNAVVLSGRPADVEQALRALDALDARPAVVAVDVLIVTGGEAPLDPKLFVGSLAEVTAALEGLKKDGVTVRRIGLDGVEGQVATKQAGEDRAFVTSSTPVPDGRGRAMQQSFTRRNMGTQVEATPRVRPDGRIALDLKIEDSRTAAQEASDGPPVFTTESFKGSVALTPNQAQVVSSSDEGRAKGSRTAFVVVARVVDAAAK